MKVTILNEYDDKELERRVKAGEVLDLDEDRIKVLKSVGVEVEEQVEDLSDDLDEDRIKTLLELYQNDRSVVDEFKVSDLKLLCEELNINYTNAKEAKEALKIITLG